MTVDELLAQKAELDRQIDQLRFAQKAEAVQLIRKLMNENGLTAKDLSWPVAPLKSNATRKPVAAKYRDPATGQTWSGRGLKPKWLSAAIDSGRALSDFLI